MGRKRSSEGGSHLLFAVEHADRMRTVTRVDARVAEFLRHARSLHRLCDSCMARLSDPIAILQLSMSPSDTCSPT